MCKKRESSDEKEDVHNYVNFLDASISPSAFEANSVEYHRMLHQ